MSKPSDWALAFARQSTADIRAWELYEQHPELVAADCHKLLFLQMACEKLCKASLIRAGAKPGDLQASHGYTAKHLPIVIGRQIMESGSDLRRMRGIITLTRHLAKLNYSIRLFGEEVGVTTIVNILGFPVTESSRLWIGLFSLCG